MPKTNKKKIDVAIPVFVEADTTPKIEIYCNLCHHTIEKHGNDWECVQKCRCMMLGCVPKKWEQTDGTV